MRNQSNLDKIIRNNKAQPVGRGYIDIIVRKKYVKNFLKEVMNEGFNITLISWWEYCPTLDTKNNLGMGGPKSEYFDGWFAEIGVNDDAEDRIKTINLINDRDQKLEKIIRYIREEKEDGCTFENGEILTPAFWLDVPDDWDNESFVKRNKA